jgi:hypothetical protein
MSSNTQRNHNPSHAEVVQYLGHLLDLTFGNALVRAFGDGRTHWLPHLSTRSRPLPTYPPSRCSLRVRWLRPSSRCSPRGACADAHPGCLRASCRCSPRPPSRSSPRDALASSMCRRRPPRQRQAPQFVQAAR